MYDRTAIIDLVEDAERHAPHCACGAPLVAREEDGALWLACSARRPERQGVLARLRALDFLAWHDRRLLLDAAELQAA
jgi:hypothetical protein